MILLSLSSWISLIVFIVLAAGVWVGWKVYQQLAQRNYAEYARRYQEIVLNLPQDIKAATFNLHAHRDYEQIMRYLRVYVDLCYEEWYLNQQRLVDRKMWASWEAGMAAMFSRPAFQQAWRVIKQDSRYGNEFAAFLERYGHHDAAKH
jgi:hypothetical protein